MAPPTRRRASATRCGPPILCGPWSTTTSSGCSTRTPRSTACEWSGPPTVRRESVEVAADGRRLSALIWGDAPPELVLLHGGAQNAHTWDTVALALDRPLRRDRPSRSRSLRPPRRRVRSRPATTRSTSPPRSAPSRPTRRMVVGMSLGGLTTIALTAHAPELVRRATLVDVTPGVDRDKAAPIAQFISGPESFESFEEILDRTVQFNPTRIGVVAAARHPPQRGRTRRRPLGVALPATPAGREHRHGGPGRLRRPVGRRRRRSRSR